MIPGLKAGATELAKTAEFHRWSVVCDFATGLGLKIYLNSPELQLGVARQIHMDSLGFSPKAIGLKPVRGLCEMIPGLKAGATERAKTAEFMPLHRVR